MHAIILAAGRGSRMKHLTDDFPKCMVKLRGKTLLEYQLEALRDGGIREISIVTGYKREMISDHGLTEFHNTRWRETNMVSSLECANALLEKGTSLVCYSDIFFSHKAITLLMQSNADIAITFDPHWRSLWERRFGDPFLDAETFRLNDAGIITEIGLKPQTFDEVQGQFMGLLRFTDKGWEEVKKVRAQFSIEVKDKMDMTRLLQYIIQAGEIPVHAIAYEDPWGEIDNANDLDVFETILPG